MIAVTAGSAAEVTITDGPVYEVPTLDVYARYLRLTGRVQNTDTTIEADLYTPDLVTPNWLEKTRAAIQNSLAPSPQVVGDGRWLSQTVVNAATDFLDATADVLPGEPYIYSSREGDLVAEFEAEHGTLTSIVSPDFVLLFAVIDGTPVHRQVDDHRSVREEVQQLTRRLLSGRDGNLEAER